jgi:hypothetical protein
MGCWLRWVALSVLTAERGPAILSDSDCLNYGFRPEHLPRLTENVHLLDAGNVCCCAYVTAAGTQMLLREMMAYHPKHQQCSDMIFFMDRFNAMSLEARGRETSFRVSAEYQSRREPQWAQYPVIHFASGATQGRANKQKVISGFKHPVSGIRYAW